MKTTEGGDSAHCQPAARPASQAGPESRLRTHLARRLPMALQPTPTPGRCCGPPPLLEPCGENLIVKTVNGAKLRTAQNAGGIGLDQGCFLFRCLAETSASVVLHKGVVPGIHTTRRFQRYAMQRRGTGRRQGPRLQSPRAASTQRKQPSGSNPSSANTSLAHGCLPFFGTWNLALGTSAQRPGRGASIPPPRRN